MPGAGCVSALRSPGAGPGPSRGRAPSRGPRHDGPPAPSPPQETSAVLCTLSSIAAGHCEPRQCARMRRR
eukprot:360365-Chlamydomonas_euryale.AAC.13